MTNYVINSNAEETSKVYDLCGIINHLGNSLSLGHYTTYARTHDKYESSSDEIGNYLAL